MKFVTTINPTIDEYKASDPILTIQAIVAYSKLLRDNNLSPYDYHPVIGWTYNNDDFVKNRITLVIEARSILEVVENGNYKDVKSESR